MPTVNGRRGSFLILFGLIYVAVGLSYIYAPNDSPVRQSMAWLPHLTDLTFCGGVWATAGLIAGVHAFLPIPKDRFGYMALAATAIAWTVAYMVSWGLGYADRGWVSAVVFAALGAATLVVSGMPNPVRRSPNDP
jgi:hypothetical protein